MPDRPRAKDYAFELDAFQKVAPAAERHAASAVTSTPLAGKSERDKKKEEAAEVATECIEKEESVLVSAHTSAGKTAVAESSRKYEFNII